MIQVTEEGSTILFFQDWGVWWGFWSSETRKD